MLKEAEMWRPIVVVLSLMTIAVAPVVGDQVRRVSLEWESAERDRPVRQDQEGFLTKWLAHLDVRDVSLAEGLISLRERSGVPLAFSPSRVDGYGNVTCACEDATVGEALGRMLARTPLRFVETPERILISRELAGSEPTPDLARPLAVLPVVVAAKQIWTRQGIITGRVTEVETGAPLQGARVHIADTDLGSVTDVEGRYVIQNVPDGEVVVQVELLGYVTASQSAAVATGETITLDFALDPDPLALDELVVTALGVERQARSLTYSTQGIDTERLTEARELNVVNSLQGKVAGLNINQSATGVGGGSRVILRGNRSITGNSQPLYVLDGVPIRGDIRDINPDNIASVDVLKGPNAAALYGSAAQNGAIVVTTRRGASGAVRFSMNQTLMLEDPLLADNYQNVYGQGTGGVYNPNSEFSWGPEMEGQMVDYWTFNDSDHMDGQQYAFLPQPDNIRDVFRTGYHSSTNLTASIGGEATQAFFSYTFTNAEGIVPRNNLRRHNMSVRVTNQLSSRLSLDGRLTYMNRLIDNQLATGENFTNPLRHIYRLPRNIRTEDIRTFEYLNNEGGQRRQNYFNVGSNGGANPYWTLNRNLRENERERVLAMASLTYSFTDYLRLMVRASYDGATNHGETRLYNDTYINAQFGEYSLTKSDGKQWNTEYLLSFERALSPDWSIDASFGGNIQQSRDTELSSNTGNGLIVPNFFTLANTLNIESTHSVGDPVDVHSLYAFGQVAWRNGLFLNVTGRNDWSSTLPADNRSYFYPSVGLSAVVSDLLTLPDFLTFARLRSSWARVGSGAPPGSLLRMTELIPGGNNGFLRLDPTLPNADLRPEQTESIELGAELGFLEGRLGFDFTWYKMNTTDQLFTVALPVGSGVSSFFTNGGDVENKGVEVLVNAVPITSPDFQWSFDLNFARNRNMVNEINDERPSLQIASDFLRAFRIEQGRPYGEVYSRGFVRDDQGRVIVGSNGVPLVTTGRTVPVANFNPDWTGSLSSTVQYRNFSLNFLIDHRQGGTIASLTNAITYADGLTKATLQGREGGLVFGENFFSDETAVLEDGSPNDIEVDAETFWRAVGGRNAPVGEAFVADATNTRLRELTLGFRFPQSVIDRLPVTDLTVSLVGRNLFFFHRKSEELDPDILVNTTASAEGFESFTPPTARTFGMNVKLSF